MKNIHIPKKLAYILLIITVLCNTIVIVPNRVSAAKTYTQTIKSGIEAFPESYQKLLKQLIDETDHTNWNFQAYYTGIDWNDYIAAESKCKVNRVYQGFDTIYRDECNNLASGYYCAHEDIIKYFADPRNFLNERNIFQFLEISYNEKIYTEKIIEKMITDHKVFNKGEEITFIMSDENHKDYNKEVTMTFTKIIMEAAKQSQMSPISIVIKIIQEVGSSGSESTFGTYKGYENCYNYYNIGAYDEGDAIANGLKYADNAGWHCPYTAIVEGAIYNSDNYIQLGQNTPYFYKFDCVGNTILKEGETQTVTTDQLYNHQYMTNVYDPYSQSAALFSTYTNNGLLEKNLNFIIPVFNNMPEFTIKPSSLSSSDQELYYADITSNVNTRKGPSTSYGNVTVEYKTASGKQVSESLVLYKDDLVIMLDRKVKNTNGTYWDKVQFWNGKIGYVASEYLEKYEPKTAQEPEEEPSNETIYEKMVDYGFANVSTTLNVRKGAGSSYKVVGSLNANQEFLILEKLDGWYKIATEDGLEGYIATKYAQTLKTYEQKNNTITIIPNTNVKMLAKMMGLSDYKILKNGKEVTTDILGTNYVLKTKDKEYTIIKQGDVNGDGKVNTGDAFLIQKHAIKTSELKNNFLLAADINKDSNKNTGDAFLVQKFAIKLKPIEL